MSVVNFTQSDIYMLAELIREVDTREIDWYAVATDSGMRKKAVHDTFTKMKYRDCLPFTKRQMQVMAIALFRPLGRGFANIGWDSVVDRCNQEAGFQLFKCAAQARRRFKTLTKTVLNAQRGQYSAAPVISILVKTAKHNSHGYKADDED